MTALLEAARSISSFRSLETPLQRKPRQGAFFQPLTLEDRFKNIGEEINKIISGPYFSAKTWREIEDSWGGWATSFEPLFQRLFQTIMEAIGGEEIHPGALEGASKSYFCEISKKMEEPLKSTFQVSIDIIQTSDRLVAQHRDRFMTMVDEEQGFRASLESSMTQFTLAVLLISCWIARMDRGEQATEDQLDFAVLKLKRCAAVYYMSVRRMLER